MKELILSGLWLFLFGGFAYWSHRRRLRKTAMAHEALLVERRARYRPLPLPNDYPTLEREQFELEDLALAHSQWMHQYDLPSVEALRALRPGSVVKLAFVDASGETERMWVTVESVAGREFTGTLENEPFDLDGASVGQRLHFNANHIMQIEPAKPSLSG